MDRILLVDDDVGGRQMTAFNLRKAGFAVDEMASGREAIAGFRRGAYQVVVTDLRMPEISGIEVVRAIRAEDGRVPMVVITADGSIEAAVDAMKSGADDFITKPFSRDQLLLTIEKASDRQRLRLENSELRRRLANIERPLVFCSKPFEDVINVADRVSQSDASVLITGESGTGKELVARRIHSRSHRVDGPFVPVNCAAIPGELIEAELFGHERGAFTGADKARLGRFRQAHGGTLFLDEVSELPAAAQGKLLRVLQEKVVDVLGADRGVSVDVRVLAATNQDLRGLVASKAFREDLFFRLNVIEISVPPLRDRVEDIPLLVDHFIKELSPDREITVPDDVLAALKQRRWPGNIRELRNACERMVLLCTGGVLSVGDLPPDTQIAGVGPGSDQSRERGPLFELPPEGISLLDLEKAVIERVLSQKNGNVSEAARYLRVPRHILAYRIEKYGITRRR